MSEQQPPYTAYAIVALLGMGGGTGVNQAINQIGGADVDLTPVIEELQAIRGQLKEIDTLKVQVAMMAYRRAKRSVAYWEDMMATNDLHIEEMSAEQQRLYRSAITEMEEQDGILAGLGVSVGVD